MSLSKIYTYQNHYIAQRVGLSLANINSTPLWRLVPPPNWPSFFFSFLKKKDNLILMNFLNSLLCIFISNSIAFSAENTFHIIIDPGHGGQDLGATRDSFIESKIVLQIAQKTKTLLDKQKNILTTLTRINNSGLSLKKRVQLAHDLKADLFVSLHANTSNSESVQGMEFYFNSPQSKPQNTDEPALPVKGSPTTLDIINKIKSDFQFYDKTEKSLLLTTTFKEKSSEQEKKSIVKRAPFYVIDHTAMPAALIELGFISNRREAKKLASEEHQNEIAHMLSTALLEYKEKSDKLNSL